MSSNRNKFQLLPLLRQAIPCWICLVVCFLSTFLALILTLRSHEQEKVQQQLHRYRTIYENNGSTGLQLAYAASGENSSSFLRLEGPDIRLILITKNNARETVRPPDFSSFPVSINLVWNALQPGRTRGSWTIAALPLADGNILQLGIDSSESLLFLRRLGVTLLKLALFLCPFCCIPAWLTVSKHNETIRKLTDQVNAMSTDKMQDLQLVNTTNPAAEELVAAVNHLLERHRRLSRELQKSMDNVAHDLRTPMTRLRSIAEYGLHKKEDAGHLHEALTDCLEESDRLLSMLNTMLNVAEAEADTVKLDLQPISLEETINPVLDLYSIIAEDRNVTIHFRPEPDLRILADPQRISQVWANLLDNAIKYNSTEITISTCRKNDKAKICFQDNGIGISANEIDRIWNRLYRGDRSRSKPGLGLGLTLVKATINSHNGTIEVTSHLDKGSIFTVYLPTI
jgi:signal transduction histidine kinase